MRVRKRRFLDITHVSPYPCKIKLENNAGLPGSCNLGWMATTKFRSKGLNMVFFKACQSVESLEKPAQLFLLICPSRQ